jgi:exosortase/archaeosortase family protein
MKLPQISRLHVLVALFAVAVVNPFTYYVLHVSRTYFWVVPLTLGIWFAFRWNSLASHPSLTTKPLIWEIALGAFIIGVTVTRGLMQDPSARMFGLFDMMFVFVGLSFILFGVRSLKAFWVPASFLAIIGAGYSLERIVVGLAGYDEFLAGMVVGVVRLLGGQAETQGAVIVLPNHASRLLVDYACAGIKGILAFSFIGAIPILESAQDLRRKAAWVALDLIGFYVASVLRLVAVVFAVMAWGQVAVDYHTMIGFAFFMAWLVVVVYFGSPPGPRSRAPAQDGTPQTV